MSLTEGVTSRERTQVAPGATVPTCRAAATTTALSLQTSAEGRKAAQADLNREVGVAEQVRGGAAEADGGDAGETELRAIVRQEVRAAIAELLGERLERSEDVLSETTGAVAKNTVRLERLLLLVHGVGALFRDCVVEREDHATGIVGEPRVHLNGFAN